MGYIGVWFAGWLFVNSVSIEWLWNYCKFEVIFVHKFVCEMPNFVVSNLILVIDSTIDLAYKQNLNRRLKIVGDKNVEFTLLLLLQLFYAHTVHGGPSGE